MMRGPWELRLRTSSPRHRSADSFLPDGESVDLRRRRENREAGVPAGRHRGKNTVPALRGLGAKARDCSVRAVSLKATNAFTAAISSVWVCSPRIQGGTKPESLGLTGHEVFETMA